MVNLRVVAFISEAEEKKKVFLETSLEASPVCCEHSGFHSARLLPGLSVGMRTDCRLGLSALPFTRHLSGAGTMLVDTQRAKTKTRRTLIHKHSMTVSSR